MYSRAAQTYDARLLHYTLALVKFWLPTQSKTSTLTSAVNKKGAWKIGQEKMAQNSAAHTHKLHTDTLGLLAGMLSIGIERKVAGTGTGPQEQSDIRSMWVNH